MGDVGEERDPGHEEPRIVDMMTSTRRALRPSGGRKVATPFEIASRPVSDDPPLAKARSTMMIEAPYRRPLPGVPSARLRSE